MSDALWLAIDQGGGSTRALVFDEAGRVRAAARRAVGEARPGPGRVEQDPEELVRSALESAAEALAALGPERARVRAAGLATQRSSIVCWERASGRALSPVLSWQDVRAEERLAPFRALGPELARRTGLVASPHYGATKLGWCLAELPAVREARARGALACGPLASFLAQRLVRAGSAAAEGPRVDPANASRTLLFALERGAWDEELAALAGVPVELLPRVVPSASEHGLLAVDGPPVPLRVLTGDQGAAFVARGRPAADTVTLNLGTGAFLLRALAARPRDAQGLLVSVLGGAPPEERELARGDLELAPGGLELAPGGLELALGGLELALGGLELALGGLELALEGTVNGAGSALAWAGRRLGLEAEEALGAALRETRDPPLFLDLVSGLGSPFWRSDLEPAWVGAEGTDSTARLAAVGEGILFLCLENLERMRLVAGPARRLVASGGLAREDELLRRLATLAGLPLERPAGAEATARGLAWLVRGVREPWPEEAEPERFEPARGGGAARLADRWLRWREALAAHLGDGAPEGARA